MYKLRITGYVHNIIFLDSASWELNQYSRRMCGPMKNPEVDTRCQESNSGPQDCEADALPQDHGQPTTCVMENSYLYYTVILKN